MKIITTNKQIIDNIVGNDLTYIYSKNDNIDELIKLSKKCKVVKEDIENRYDIAIDCNNTNSNMYLNNLNIEEIKEKIKNYSDIKKKDYKFSIIIPNYNYEEWLDKCLNSVLNQTYKNFEIVFIDDCSIDNSVKIAKKLLRPQDKIIELKSKRLNGGARNEGLVYTRDNSDSDYIVFLDSDDWLKNDKVLEDINKSLFRTRCAVLWCRKMEKQ